MSKKGNESFPKCSTVLFSNFPLSQCRTDEVGSRPPGGEEDFCFLADPDGRSLRRRSRPRRRFHYDLQRHTEEEQQPRNHEEIHFN